MTNSAPAPQEDFDPSNELLQIKMSIQARVRSNLAGHFLASAASLARRAGQIERENETSEWGPFGEELLQSVFTSVVMAAISLESYANERFADADDMKLPGWPSLRDVERLQALQKFNLALVACEAKRFDEGTQPAQRASMLFRVRDALVHFKPEWDDATGTHSKLSGKLQSEVSKSRHFINSPFPQGFLSHSFASWGVKTALDFVAEFSKRAGLPDRYVESNLDFSVEPTA